MKQRAKPGFTLPFTVDAVGVTESETEEDVPEEKTKEKE